MLTVPRDRIGRDVDLGTIDVTPERVRRYAEVIGDRVLATGPCDVAPLGFTLALRGKPVPEVDTAGDTVSVHAGHAITLYRPLTAPGTYRLRARIADVFEKSGRSGPLTVIQRRAEIRALDGSVVATVDDQQIVRWRRGATGTRATAAVRRGGGPTGAYQLDDDVLGEALDLEVGAQLPAQRRLAPSAEAIALYAQSLGGREPLFLDRDFVGSLGYTDVIVPGPLQSALLESMLRRQLPAWGLRQLTLSFRVSVVAGQPITLTAIVVERHLRRNGTTLLCDLAIENDDGERTALGTAGLDAT